MKLSMRHGYYRIVTLISLSGGSDHFIHWNSMCNVQDHLGKGCNYILGNTMVEKFYDQHPRYIYTVNI